MGRSNRRYGEKDKDSSCESFEAVKICRPYLARARRRCKAIGFFLESSGGGARRTALIIAAADRINLEVTVERETSRDGPSGESAQRKRKEERERVYPWESGRFLQAAFTPSRLRYRDKNLFF